MALELAARELLFALSNCEGNADAEAVQIARASLIDALAHLDYQRAKWERRHIKCLKTFEANGHNGKRTIVIVMEPGEIAKIIDRHETHITCEMQTNKGVPTGEKFRLLHNGEGKLWEYTLEGLN